MTLATVPKSEVTMVINVHLHVSGFCLFREISSGFATEIGLEISWGKKANNLDKLFSCFALMSDLENAAFKTVVLKNNPI